MSQTLIFAGSVCWGKIIGFNIKIPQAVAKLAQMEKVRIKTYNIIYHLLEDIQKESSDLLERISKKKFWDEPKSLLSLE
jgi:translation initiation factor IF-2